jgi:hypothetical protein
MVGRSFIGSTMSGRRPPDAFPPPAVGRGRETRRPRRPDATILLVSRMTERRLSTGTADRCRLTTHGRVDLRLPDRIGWCRVGPHRELASVIALPASARRWDCVPERARRARPRAAECRGPRPQGCGASAVPQARPTRRRQEIGRPPRLRPVGRSTPDHGWPTRVHGLRQHAHLHRIGPCTVTATQAVNLVFPSATPVQRSFMITTELAVTAAGRRPRCATPATESRTPERNNAVTAAARELGHPGGADRAGGYRRSAPGYPEPERSVSGRPNRVAMFAGTRPPPGRGRLPNRGHHSSSDLRVPDGTRGVGRGPRASAG